MTSKKTAARETKIYLEGLINRPGCSNVDLVDKSLSSGSILRKPMHYPLDRDLPSG